MKGRKLVWESLQPGCVILRYDPDQIEPHQITFLKDCWEELEKRGFYGGMILPKHIRLTSLNDEELTQLGLKRIPKTRSKT